MTDATATFNAESTVSMGQCVPATGLCGDALVMTAEGPRRVDSLRAGDLVLTRTGLTAIAAINPIPVHGDIVNIAENHFGPGQPMRQSAFVAQQKILRRNALNGRVEHVALIDLVDGDAITHHRGADATLFDVRFQRVETIYCDGLETNCYAA